MDDIEFLNRYIDRLNRTLHDVTSKNVILEAHLEAANAKIAVLEAKVAISSDEKSKK